jgi:hypothetical protein
MLKMSCVFNCFLVSVSFIIISYGFVAFAVAECKSASSYQGVCGIMIRDTAETFGIISDDNRFRGNSSNSWCNI